MQQTTSDRIGLVLTPQQLVLGPDSRADVVLDVVNHGSVVDQFTLLVEGLDVRWYEIGAGTVNLLPDAAGQLRLQVHYPAGEEVLAGVHPLTLRVISREDPAVQSLAVLTIEVQQQGIVEMVIAPRRVVIGRFRRAQYGIEVRNASNSEQLIDLVLADPNEVLDANLALDRLSLAPAASEIVGLTLRPRRRPWLAPRLHYPFIVTATRPIADTDLTEPVAAADRQSVV